MIVRFRPLPTWPHAAHLPGERRWHPFSASWTSTLHLLEREIGNLGGSNVIIAGGWRESDIRLDGMPRADAREPAHPGVEISFDSRFGRLTYATDVCSHWRDNVRSIALGLEALRAVSRFGVADRGQQYAGWKALPAQAMGGMTREAAEALLGPYRENGSDWRSAYRAAVKRTHPDAGGDAGIFAAIQAAGRALEVA